MKELVPTGKLRVALVFAPSKSLFFNIKDGEKAAGVTADIAAALAEKLGVPVEQVVYPNSGLATDALEAGAVDVSFMPVDEDRKKRIAFGPNYVIAESTYMVTAASGAKTAEDVDRPGMRVIGIAGTATIRMVTRTLKNTTISPVTSVDDAVAAMRDGKADAFALGRDSLPPYIKQVPGSRMTEGAFHHLPIAIAVAKNKPAALAAVTTKPGSKNRWRREAVMRLLSPLVMPRKGGASSKRRTTKRNSDSGVYWIIRFRG